ncbi:helix-turn-helix domain-containing protein [Streptococcus danieliae]|uniref:helix-turn-helix domain-containing protein n=1 Tax=Streptococcus danieliae TaxID=747656 RepID=UPI00359F21DA
MESYGKVFKMLRESKNLSLAEVAGDYISTAQLSRFENGNKNFKMKLATHPIC